MGEFRASQQGHRVEWIILWLGGAEVTLSLIQTLLKRKAKHGSWLQGCEESPSPRPLCSG